MPGVNLGKMRLQKNLNPQPPNSLRKLGGAQCAPPPRTLEAAEGLRYPPVVLVLLYPLMISFYYILLLYPHVILLLSYPLVCCSPLLSIRFPFDSLLLSPFFHLHLLLLLHFQPLSPPH